MTYESFVEEYISKGLLKKQKTSFTAIEKLIFRCEKDLRAAKANLSIDEGIAYAVAYLAMLRAGKTFMLLKGLRPTDGYQHKTVVEFIDKILGSEYRNIIERFDRMRRRRNIFTYEFDVFISMSEAEGAFDTAVKFVNIIKERIKKESPQTEFKF